MKLLLSEMQKELTENCVLSEELKNKIDNLNFYRVPKDYLFADDYVFNCKYEKFEKATRGAFTFGHKNLRTDVKHLDKIYPDGDIFNKFELMHLVIFQMQNRLMPTCMIVYSDDTFEFNSFESSIKTTVYRKFYEIAKRIEKDKITNILFVTEMYIYDVNEVNNLDSKERVKYAKNEILSFYMVDNKMNSKLHSFESKKVNDSKYISSIIDSEPFTQVLPKFMNPVIEEFSRLREYEK
jgi:hypothetical protein